MSNFWTIWRKKYIPFCFPFAFLHYIKKDIWKGVIWHRRFSLRNSEPWRKKCFLYCVVILNFWIWSSHYKMHCSLITNSAERDKVGSSCGILAMAISFLQGRAADFIVHLCLFFLLIHVTELSLKFLPLKNFSCHSIIYLMSRFTTKAGCISSYSSLCCLSLYKVYSFGCLLLWQMCTGGTSW